MEQYHEETTWQIKNIILQDNWLGVSNYEY